MSLFDWFADRRKATPMGQQHQEREIPDGLWHKCSSCSALAYIKDLRNNLMVCPECGHHMQVNSSERIAQLTDPGSWTEINDRLHSCDPLEFRDRKPYSARLRETQESTGLSDSVVTGLGSIEGSGIALGVMDFRFMGGSMGSVVGEKLTRLIETATQKNLPVAIVCASGGARMQEGILSLMQMAKTSAALERHRQARLLYVPILTHPTTGGVTASFAMLGDIILAEPKAMIAFTGRRVIEQTLKQKIPDDFQSAEYLLEHGFVDAVVPRTQLKQTLAAIVRMHAKPVAIDAAKPIHVQSANPKLESGMHLLADEMTS
jgi:acetyl-CoA carboxylase carboxyl transferase subunit beta